MTGDHSPGRLAPPRHHLANGERLVALGRQIDQRTDVHDPDPQVRRTAAGVLGNARLTSSLAAVVFVLLAVEGVTIVLIHNLLNAHVFVGILLIPPILAKISSTGWRFAKYYSGSPAYRQKGPPLLFLRLLGPLVVVLTLIVLASGVALIALPTSFRATFFFIHRASFVLWIGVTAIHVLGHLAETVQLAPRDWLARTRRQVSGASMRQWVIVWTIAVGLIAAVLVTPSAYGWFAR